MNIQANDQSVLQHIQHLVEEAHRPYGQGALADVDRERLAKLEHDRRSNRDGDAPGRSKFEAFFTP